MSCPNFETQEWFPLYVLDWERYREKVCNECGEYVNALYDEEDFDGDECPYCGGELSAQHFNETACYDDSDCIQKELDEENDKLTFFEIRFQGGYWGDAQLIVNLTKYADYCWFDIDGDDSNVDNYNTQYYFNCCRSECIRRFNVEHNKVLKIMQKIADEWSMEELSCCGIFSNGEAVYKRVEKKGKKGNKVA